MSVDTLVPNAAEAVLLEYQSPSTAIIHAPVPPFARRVVPAVAALFASSALALGLIPVDKVVSASGRVVSSAPNVVVQPLETSILRSVEVHEGQSVHKGDLLARLDPTFASADTDALQRQVTSLSAEVGRLRAEAAGAPFSYSGSDTDTELQSAIFAQRFAEREFKLENYAQKIAALGSASERAKADMSGYARRLGVASQVEGMRTDLERMAVGSRLNTLSARDSRLETQRALENSVHAYRSSSDDLAAMRSERDGYLQNWKAEVSQKLTEQSRAFSDARENLAKAQLRRRMVEMRADRDATVLTVAKVSAGAVLQSGDELLRLVPDGSTAEVEVNISGKDDGFVKVGDPVAIKFDTFAFTQYGLAEGRVRTVSADSFTAQDDQRVRYVAPAVPVSPSDTQPFFRARVEITHVGLRNVPLGFKVAPGMPITADIKVGKRTVLQYLLGKVLPVTREAMREP